MIDILYIENKKQLLPEYTAFIETFLGDTEKNKAYRYRRWQDKQAYLLGKLLIAQLLSTHNFSPLLLKNIAYTKNNRPYITGETFDFNISHSAEFVIGAFSAHQKIGIDIEQIQPIDLNDLFYVLNKDEKERVVNSENMHADFFRIWSAKEAILKAEGTGLINDLPGLQINGNTGNFNKTLYYLNDLSIHPLYSCCIAGLAPVDAINMKQVSSESCFNFLSQ